MLRVSSGVRVLRSLVLLSVCAFAGVGHAEVPGTSEPIVADEALARAYHRTGQLAFESGRFAEAAEQFGRAAALSPRPAILFNLGKALDAAHDAFGARAAYRRVLAAPEGTVPTEERGVLRARVAELDREIARLAVRDGAAGAEVRVDGRVVGTTPLSAPIELNAGTHAIAIEHPRVGRLRGTLSLVGGETMTFDASALVTRADGRVGPPIYKRWWLWTIVGVVLAGGAATAGVLGARAVERASVPSSALPGVTP